MSSKLWAVKSIHQVSEDLKLQSTLVTKNDPESDPTRNNAFAAGMFSRNDHEHTQIETEITPHIIDQSDLNFAWIHLLNHFSHPIYQLANLWNVSFELPEKWLWKLIMRTGIRIMMRPLSRACEQKPVSRYFRIQNWIQLLQTSIATLIWLQTKESIKQIIIILGADIKTFDDLWLWYAMTNRELQNQVDWCLTIVIAFTNHVELDQYFSLSQRGKFDFIHSSSNIDHVGSKQWARRPYGYLNWFHMVGKISASKR